MFGQTLKQWFWDCYDVLGRLLVLNLLLVLLFTVALVLWSAALGPLYLALPPAGAVLLTAACLAIVGPVLGTLWFAPLLHFGKLSSAGKEPELRDAWAGLRACGARVGRYLALWCAAAALLFSGVWFYWFSGALPESLRLAGAALGALAFWGLMYLLAMAAHGLPLAARREGHTARRTLRDSALLPLKYPLLTFSSILFLGSLWVIGAGLKFTGILLFGFAGTAMFLNSLRDIIGEAESVLQEGSEIPINPTSWRAATGLVDANNDAEMRRARYSRTLRDILRPWEQ